MLDEVMQIKAAELKTLGKEVLLGNKFCDVTELFSAEPQLMTVNLNPTGSLKLNILVTWWYAFRTSIFISYNFNLVM